MNLVIDRIEITLEGVADSDARMLASELPAALDTRLGGAGDAARGAGRPADDGPLETALRGRALVAAIAARLADAIGDEHRRAAESDRGRAGGVAPADDRGETTWP